MTVGDQHLPSLRSRAVPGVHQPPPGYANTARRMPGAALGCRAGAAPDDARLIVWLDARTPSGRYHPSPSDHRKARSCSTNRLRQAGIRHVETGEFGAMMLVEIHNDGPFTIILDSDDLSR